MKPWVASTMALFLLSGCYNQPGLVKDNSYERTKTGAALGAVTGALIGYNTKGHDKGQRALIGGLLGAALGGAAGYSLDKQANEVANALGTGVNNDPLVALDPRKDIIVSKYPNYVKMIFRDKMMFATNSATLQPNAKYKINKVATLLERYPQTIVGIAGFTDNQGSFSYNQKLSKARAVSVAKILGKRNQVKIKGCSYAKPIAPNDTAQNRALNRRVEVYLYSDASKMTDPCR